jgi:hypothetical protein
MAGLSLVNQFGRILLSAKSKEQMERAVLTVSILSYIAHLVLIVLSNKGILQIDSKLFKNPIAAIYTPFSFILVYEVFLLVFFIPQSSTIYIRKQYEIITLIVIRRIFKDIAHLELDTNWFQNRYDLQFTYDVGTSLLLFFLIFLFYYTNSKRVKSGKLPVEEEDKVRRFILLKKWIAVLLYPVLAALALYSLFNWLHESVNDYRNGLLAFENINAIFFEEFFTVLIVVDVLLLLFSFYYSDAFHTIIRNSGFVISTILLKISFSETGIVNNALIVGAVLFGYLVLVIHDLYERKMAGL